MLRLVTTALLALAAALASPVYRSGSVRRPDGATIAYYVRDGKGPNLVLIPGSWGDHRVFDRMVDQLPPGIRVIVVELRGHGASQPATLQPSMALFADDVLHVVDSLGLRRYYVGGHSIGGMLTIEIAGRRPAQVAGAIPMEGWTHHMVSPEAFGSATATTMTPEQQRINEEQRNRVLRKLTPGERAAFASVWKQWDGLPILESVSVPFLELWGDRGQPRPPRAKLRIPDRPNLELAWISGSSHSLLVQAPEEVARLTARFVESVESRHMFEVPDGEDLGRLPRLDPEVIPVYRGVEGVTGFNMHPYLAEFQGKLWAMWSCNRIRDLQAGQYIRYAVSRDGRTWTEPAILSPPEEKENLRSFARGFWVRGPGELIALVARDEAVRPLFGPGLELRGFRWSGGAWKGPLTIAKDTINNFAPVKLPGGEWMMTRRDHKMRIGMLTGGIADPASWTASSVPLPADGAKLDEPTVWTLPDGSLTAAFRDGSRSRRLYRSFTNDGKSWTAPVRTDFPDAMAKFNVLRLSNGMYAMASNPNPSGKRIPLCLSLSEDGKVFTRMAILRDADTIYRYSGKDPGYAGYHYPQLLEHGGFLYVIHAENMEDIVLLRVPMAKITRLARRPERLLSQDSLLAAPGGLPPAPGRHSTVFAGKSGESGFNLHSYLAHHGGQFWAVWSSSRVHEEDPDQRVLYATSRDGHRWSEPRELVADPDGPLGPARWIARGVYVSKGKLTALAAYIESAAYGQRGRQEVWRNLRLMRFEWNGRSWDAKGVFADNCMNNFPPQPLNGVETLVCRDSNMDVSMALAEAGGGWKRTPVRNEPPFDRMDEPTYYVAQGGEVHMIIRDNTRSGFLIRAISEDHGRTWSKPVRTNYPDATSKNFPGRLSNGWFYLINNPDQRKRDPLVITFSRDGWEFSRPLSIRSGVSSVQYPHAIEHGGSLWVIYSIGKRDIEIAELPVRRLEPGR